MRRYGQCKMQVRRGEKRTNEKSESRQRIVRLVAIDADCRLTVGRVGVDRTVVVRDGRSHREGGGRGKRRRSPSVCGKKR
jgi:hypothetical protein